MIVDIETLVKAEISINQYLLACFIVENNQDGFIEYVNACGKFHERDVQMLINNKYLIYTGDGTTYNFYELHPTKRLDDLTKTMREEEGFLRSLSIVEDIKKSPAIDDFSSFVASFRELFPNNVRPNGKPVKSPLVDLKKKLKYFEKEYKDYSREEILTAAAHYVGRYKNAGYAFMRTAVYFIHKQHDGSDLAAEIESIREKGLQVKVTMYGTELT
jgi:hypothetical protein